MIKREIKQNEIANEFNERPFFLLVKIVWFYPCDCEMPHIEIEKPTLE